MFRPCSHILLALALFAQVLHVVQCQEEMFVLEQSPDEQQGGFSSHIVALRPDYTFWKMVNVLKTMFDTRTTEKRRPRDAVEEAPATKLPNLRARRLLLNFGRYRI